MNVLLIAVGGFLGAICRYGTTQFFIRKNRNTILSTLTVNLLGSLLMGISVHTLFSHPMGSAFFSIGFLGAFTTFSTFSYEVVTLLTTNKRLKSIAYASLTLLGGILFFIVGWWISS